MHVSSRRWVAPNDCANGRRHWLHGAEIFVDAQERNETFTTCVDGKRAALSEQRCGLHLCVVREKRVRRA